MRSRGSPYFAEVGVDSIGMEAGAMAQTSRERARLSVALIVRNCEESLRESLESVHAIADEIVVLDTGSTDSTPRIAAQRATRLVSRAWDEDFSAARNACLSHVTGDWVLWLDAGESLSAEDARQIRDFLDQQAEITKAYALLVKVPQQGGNIAGEQVARVRLVPNLPGIQFRGRVRESVTKSLAENGIAVDGLPFRIQRGAREHDPQTKVRKARRNLLLADLETNALGPNSRLLNCIGDALQVIGDNAQAAAFFRQSLALAPRGSTEMLEAYYGLLTTFDSDPNNRQVQLAVCLQSLEIFPLDAQLLCAMGGYLQSQGRLDLATRAYQTAYQYGQVHPATWHLDEIREIAAACYSLALQLQGQPEAGRQVLEEAVAAHPHSLRLHRQLIDLHVKSGRRVEALAAAKMVPPTMPHVEAYRSAVRGACLAHEQNWLAAKSYLETAYQSGCRESLCLRWLTITLLSLGDVAAVRPIVDEWKHVEPANAEAQSFWSALHAPPTAEADLPPRETAPAPESIRDPAKRIVRIDEQPADQPGTTVAKTHAPLFTHSPAK